MNGNNTTKYSGALNRRKSEIHTIAESMITGAAAVWACSEQAYNISCLRNNVAEFRKLVEIHSHLLERLAIKLEQEALLYDETEQDEDYTL